MTYHAGQTAVVVVARSVEERKVKRLEIDGWLKGQRGGVSEMEIVRKCRRMMDGEVDIIDWRCVLERSKYCV